MPSRQYYTKQEDEKEVTTDNRRPLKREEFMLYMTVLRITGAVLIGALIAGVYTGNMDTFRELSFLAIGTMFGSIGSNLFNRQPVEGQGVKKQFKSRNNG